MLRDSLKQGDIVCFKGIEIIIDSVIGYGATCIVYSAHYYDVDQNCYLVNLKECYPYIADVKRVDGVLSWGSADLKEQYCLRFREAHKKVMSIQNIARNTTVNSLGIDEVRGTVYSAMSVLEGETFDKSQCSLTSALKIARSLAETVKKYHQNGYLHLDIKPANFLTINETAELVIVFDMDTVTSMKSIAEGDARGCSYTDSWSAPEQKQGLVYKLCPATDIFSIGAVLFEKIMGRIPNAIDKSWFAEWDFEGELFDKVNPKIKRLLTDIFRKTISAAIKRRYQSADELIEALDEAIKVSEQTMYLVSNCPMSTTRFVGRDDDIRLIDKALEDGKVVFLHGEGGIGKSTLAIEYASRRKKIFDAVIFLRYQSSLESLVDSITIVNFEGDFDQKQKELKSLLDENILLIIDNFDVAVDEESKFLEKVLSYNCKLIFTTRTNFDIYKGEATQIEVGRLSDCDSVEVFENASGIKVDDEDYNQLLEMFAFVGFNTFVIELLGKQVYSSGYTIGELYDRLVNGVDSLSKSAKIKALKDGKVIKEKVPEIIRVLFDMSKLSDEKLNALRNLYLLGFLNIEAKTYRKFTNAEDESCTDTLNDLADLGWVRKSGRVYSLHPLIEELVKKDLKPCRENCESVFECMDDIFESALEMRFARAIDRLRYKNKYSISVAFWLRLDYYIKSNFDYVVNNFFALLKMRKAIGYDQSPEIKHIINKLLMLLDSDGISDLEKFYIAFLYSESMEQGFCYYTNIFHRGGVIVPLFLLGCADNICEVIYENPYEAVKEAFGKLKNEDRAFAEKLLREMMNPSTFRKKLEDDNTACSVRNDSVEDEDYDEDDDWLDFDDYGLFYDAVDDGSLYADVIEDCFSDMRPNRFGDLMERYCYKNLIKVDDKIQFLSFISANNKLSFMNKVECITRAVDDIFRSSLNYGAFPYIPREECKIGWEDLRCILDFHEKLLLDKETEKGMEADKYINTVLSNLVYQINVFVKLNDSEAFESAMDKLLDMTEKLIELYLAEGIDWQEFAEFDYNYYRHFYSVIAMLSSWEKESWGIKYLILFASLFAPFMNGRKYHQALVTVYTNIVQMANSASDKADITEKTKTDYETIACEYQKKIDELTGKDFSFKFNE